MTQESQAHPNTTLGQAWWWAHAHVISPVWSPVQPGVELVWEYKKARMDDFRWFQWFDNEGMLLTQYMMMWACANGPFEGKIGTVVGVTPLIAAMVTSRVPTQAHR